MRFILIVFVFILYAQEDLTQIETKTQTTTGSVGTVTFNGKLYNQLSIRPEIPIGKLGLGLDIYLYFNDEGIYWDSWNFSSGINIYKTIIDKIYYLRWGKPGDNLYFMAGALPSVTLGQGILISSYTNLIEYPQVRQIGFNLHLNNKSYGIEFIHSNIKSISPSVLGIRGFKKITPKLMLGISFAADMDQLSGLSDIDGDNYPDYYDYYPDDEEKWDDLSKAMIEWDGFNSFLDQQGYDILLDSKFDKWFSNSKYYNPYNPNEVTSDPISGISIDLTYKIKNNFYIYSQFGALNGKIIDPGNTENSKKLGWGLVPLGASTNFGPVDFKAEYRIGKRRFVFNYWDRAYDLNRVTIINSSGKSEIATKESQLYKFGELRGFYAQADLSVLNIFILKMGYQSMKGEKWDQRNTNYVDGENNQSFLSTIEINSDLIPKVGKLEVFYQQSNVPDPFDFKPSHSTIWGYDLGLEVSSGVLLVYKSRTIYIVDLNNVGKFIPIESIQIETQFIF